MSERPAGWLSDREIGEVDPADKAAFRSPVPTQVVSNGEYNPTPQTEQQRQVEGLDQGVRATSTPSITAWTGASS